MLDVEAFRCAWERLVGSDMLRGNLLGDTGDLALPLLVYLAPFGSPGRSCVGPFSTSMLLRLLDRSLVVERSDRTCTWAKRGQHGLRLPWLTGVARSQLCTAGHTRGCP